ncbi:MAG: hypothetical protein WD359_06015 [Dehalococcoidia bacterium]
MPKERAFAINASPAEIYAAIERDLQEADQHQGDTFAVLHRDPPRSIDLRVTIGGVSCWLTYCLHARDDYTEVVGTVTPYGWKYAFFKTITFGMRDQGFEVALIEGLANLKAEVEGTGLVEIGADDDGLPSEQ